LLQGLTSKWSFRLTAAGDLPAGPNAGARAPGLDVNGHRVSPLIARALSARGLDQPARAGAFLDPRLLHLHDPSLIPDLDKAAARLLDALKRDEPIVIYGDYDVDGITATAILYHTFRALKPDANVRSYVPHRLEEGYGLNSDAIRELVAAGARVIVSVDCGVTAVEPAFVARELGIDLIITDHHNPPATIGDLPKAFAVVHPRRPDSVYPFGDLSGAGVAYKLAWRLCTLFAGDRKVTPELRTLLVDLLAFAAIGAVADIVPLIGENRVITRHGLVRAETSQFIGLRALVEQSGLLDQKLGPMEVGFRLGPRLNAAGRMGHAKDAMELFTTADEHRAREIAKKLSEQNDARRTVEKLIFDQACEMADSAGMTRGDHRAIVLAHPAWHAGVVGIVCSRLVERFHRPTILMNSAGGVCHGSGRSVEGYNLHAGLTQCAEHLDKYGGHNMAAGLHLSEVKLPAFTEAFVEHANSAIDETDLCARIDIDCEAATHELTLDTVQRLNDLGPFGAGNPEICVLVRDMVIRKKAPMGAAGKHASVWLGSKDPREERVFRAVGWDWGRHLDQLPIGATVDAAFSPRISTFTGSPVVEPELADIHVK
jgi:single-stranded-DNA-specific exonuclease